MNRINQIVEEIKSKNTKPIYFLMGEEAYYIDKIADFIENNILEEAEKGFNQMVLYGRDVTIEDIVANAKRFPMMAEKQVVIVKEAQDLSRTIDRLLPYAENPQPSTVLVICYKYKSLDKRKKLGKVIAEKGVLFESKKLYENQVGDWISANLRDRGFDIEPKAAHMLVEFLGTDLSKIDNELEKLSLILQKGTVINANHVEENIGISKDFNNFELRKAIGDKQFVRANQIINYFAENPRTHPLVMTISFLAYGIAGGLVAAVVTDLIQGLFIIGIAALQGPQDAVDRMNAAFAERRQVIVAALRAAAFSAFLRNRPLALPDAIRGRRAGLDEALIEQILKLGPPRLEAHRVGIGQVVRDVVHVHLLGRHAINVFID